MFVATKKFMSRQSSGAARCDKLVETKFYVITQDTPVVTRTRLFHLNSVVIESKEKYRKLVAIETVGQDRIWGIKMKTLLQHNFLCHDRVTNWARFFLGSIIAALSVAHHWKLYK